MLTDQIAQRIPTEIETNGTISPQDFTEHVHFAVSPKLTNSGNPWNRAIKPNVLAELNERNASFKFALSNPNQIREVRQLQHEIGIHSERIWIMPEARYPAEILAKMEWLTLDAEAHGWNVSTRLLGLTDYTESETEE
jgi:organic radical activating enzyme